MLGVGGTVVLGVGVRVGGRFNALSYVREDFLGAEHAVCVEAGVTVGGGDGGEGVGVWVQDEGDFDCFFGGDLVLFVSRTVSPII